MLFASVLNSSVFKNIHEHVLFMSFTACLDKFQQLEEPINGIISCVKYFFSVASRTISNSLGNISKSIPITSVINITRCNIKIHSMFLNGKYFNPRYTFYFFLPEIKPKLCNGKK